MLRLPRLMAVKRWMATMAAGFVLAACGGGDGGDSSAQSLTPQSVPSDSDTGMPGQGSGSGQATLAWTAPDENTDGSALTNLAGYRIYYGTSSDALDLVIDIPTVGSTTYVVDDLSAGTYYFSIRAYNSDGSESALSNIVTDTIPSS
jgi:hypothetical protein